MEASGSQVLMVDATDGTLQEPFPEENWTSWCGQWSPDSRFLAAYVHTGMGFPCLGIWERETRKARILQHVHVRPFFPFETIQWTPDSRSVVVKLRPASMEEPQKEQKHEKVVTVFSFDPAEQEGQKQAPPAAFTARSRCDLGVVDIFSEEVRVLVRDWEITGWQAAPNGQGVAVLRHVGSEMAKQQHFFDLVVLPLADGEPRILAQQIPQNYGIIFAWSPDSQHIAYCTNERGQVPRLFVVRADGSEELLDLTGEKPRWLIQDDYLSLRWSEDSKKIYALDGYGCCMYEVEDRSQHLFHLDPENEVRAWVQASWSCSLLTGAIRWIVQDKQTHNTRLIHFNPTTGKEQIKGEIAKRLASPTHVELAPDGQSVFLVLEAADHPAELWRIDYARDDQEQAQMQRLCTFNPQLERIACGTSRLIEWRAGDGENRHGALFLPPGYTEGQQLPLVVCVYGGAFSSNSLHEFGGGEDIVHGQFLLTHGYALLHPDVPLPNRDPLRHLSEQILPAINRVIDLHIADPDRIGVMGQSYGGYSTLALITQTKRFRAAISNAGMVNLTSFYGAVSPKGDSVWQGWTESGQARLHGSLWEKRNAYIENSPLFYFDRVETPLLITCGTRVPGETGQAGEAFNALRRLNKRVEARLYHDEDHWPGMWSPASLCDLYESVLRWFDTYLKK